MAGLVHIGAQFTSSWVDWNKTIPDILMFNTSFFKKYHFQIFFKKSYQHSLPLKFIILQWLYEDFMPGIRRQEPEESWKV